MVSRNISFNRIDHFKNILEDVQGKTSIYFDDNFINQLTNNSQNTKFTPEYIRVQLKKHKLQKYYEFIPAILRKLQVEVLEFTKEEENTLCELFEEVSKTHSILYPGESFLPYHYILYRLAEYINYKKLHLIKITEYNRIMYDKKWEQICQELDWIVVVPN